MPSPTVHAPDHTNVCFQQFQTKQMSLAIMSISVTSSCGTRLFSYIYSNSVEKRRKIYYYYLSGVPPGWAGLYPTGGSAASIAEPITRAEGKGDGGSTTSGLSGPPSTGLSLLEQVVEGGTGSLSSSASAVFPERMVVIPEMEPLVRRSFRSCYSYPDYGLCGFVRKTMPKQFSCS